jgi:CBS domain-containing protein
MEQIRTAAPTKESSFHPRPAAATVTDLVQLPPTTVQQHDHAAAAAYLMKHAGTTAFMVVDARAGQPTGIITAADIARAIADGKDVNDVWVDAVMTTRPAIIATTSIRDAAEMMTTRHLSGYWSCMGHRDLVTGKPRGSNARNGLGACGVWPSTCQRHPAGYAPGAGAVMRLRKEGW